MNPLAAVFKKLSEDSNITDELGTWDNDPAIISVSPIPDEMEGTFVTLAEGAAETERFRGVAHIKQPIEIGVFTDNETTLLEVRSLAAYIRMILDAQSFEGDTENGCANSFCSYPARSVSENGFQGYTMTCTVQGFIEQGD